MIAFWHTQQAHDERLRQRYGNPQPPATMSVYWHAALMPGWRSIAREQLALAAFAGLSRMHVGILGNQPDQIELASMAVTAKVSLDIFHVSEDFHEYENPTLQALWNAARSAPQAAYLYWHTKGVSAPADVTKRTWRRIMQRYVVADWRFNVGQLALFDFVGTNWQNSNTVPHFQGNFWIARGEWIANLTSPIDYRKRNQHVNFANQPWNRMHAEAWLGSQQWHHSLSRDYWDLRWDIGQANNISTDIPGFSYLEYDVR